MKKILFLGAAVFQLPAIHYALSKNYQVITCDNRPKNPGHRLAEKSFYISTTDQQAVLELAKKEAVDALLSYASDVGVPTVAFVAAQLGLPGPDAEAVSLLTHKARFRKFLYEKKLQSGVRFQSFLKAQKAAAQQFAETMAYPFIIKPVDAAGSRGVSKVFSRERIIGAIDLAFSESPSGEIIIESFFEKKGMQVCANGFIAHGKIDFISFGDGYFYNDGALMAPWAESFPSSHDPAVLEKLKQEVEKIFVAARYMGPRPFNVDALIGSKGELFIIEIAPRSGGNYMDEAICLGSGVDLAAAAVETALGQEIQLNDKKKDAKEFYACFMVHSLKSGTLESVYFDQSIRENIVRYVPYITEGEKVRAFTQGNHAVGNVIFRFSSPELMREKMRVMPSFCYPILSGVTTAA